MPLAWGRPSGQRSAFPRWKKSFSSSRNYTKDPLSPLAGKGKQADFPHRLFLELAEEPAMRVANIDGQGYVSRKGMRAAAEALSRAREATP